MVYVPDPSLTPQQYRDELKLIADEVFEANYFFYAMEEVNDQLLNDPKVYLALNRTPLFWQAHRSASQTALFMTLGRIFDIADDALSIYRLLRITFANIHLFSRQSLKARRIGENKEAPQYLIDFVENAWEPQSASDLRFLKDAIKPHATQFEEIYRPIRHKIYGHRLMTDAMAAVDLFPKTSRPQLAEIIDCLHGVTDCLENLFNNGRSTALSFDYAVHNQQIRNDAKTVMQMLAKNEVLDEG